MTRCSPPPPIAAAVLPPSAPASIPPRCTSLRCRGSSLLVVRLLRGKHLQVLLDLKKRVLLPVLLSYLLVC